MIGRETQHSVIFVVPDFMLAYITKNVHAKYIIKNIKKNPYIYNYIVLSNYF